MAYRLCNALNNVHVTAPDACTIVQYVYDGAPHTVHVHALCGETRRTRCIMAWHAMAWRIRGWCGWWVAMQRNAASGNAAL